MSKYLVKGRIRYKGKIIEPGNIRDLEDALVELAVTKGKVLKVVPAEGGKTKTVVKDPDDSKTSPSAPRPKEDLPASH